MMIALQLWLQNHNRKMTQDAIDEALMEYISHVEKERDELKLVVSAHADFFSSTQSEMADLKESVECLSATNDFLIGKRDENIILKAAVKQLTTERDALKQQRDDLLAAAEAIEIDAEECLDFDECTAMLVSIDAYHRLMEAIASINEK